MSLKWMSKYVISVAYLLINIYSFKQPSFPFIKRHSLFCIDKIYTPLPTPIDGFREDADKSWQTPPSNIEFVSKDKLKIRPQLITFDAYQILFEPTESIGRWYRSVLNEVCGMNIRLPRPQLFTKAYEKEFSIMCSSHPCFGATKGMSSRDWWYEVVKNTYHGTDLLSGCLDYNELESVIPMAFEELYEKVFSTKLGWQVKENVVYTLTKFVEWRDQGGGPKLGVIANFDDRLEAILEDLDLKKYFNFILTSQQANVEKPNPLIFDLALNLSAGSEAPSSHSISEHQKTAGFTVRSEPVPTSIVPASSAYHIGYTIDEDIVGAAAAGWTGLVFRQWYDETFPDWHAIESEDDADEGAMKRRRHLEWGRRDPDRNNLEWIELWDLDEILHLCGFPDDYSKPIRTTYVRGFLTDEI